MTKAIRRLFMIRNNRISLLYAALILGAVLMIFSATISKLAEIVFNDSAFMDVQVLSYNTEEYQTGREAVGDTAEDETRDKISNSEAENKSESIKIIEENRSYRTELYREYDETAYESAKNYEEANNIEGDNQHHEEVVSNEVLPAAEDDTYKHISVETYMTGLHSLTELRDYNTLISSMYIVDASTSASTKYFNIDKMIAYDLTIAKNKKKPQILIYHTHTSEAYIDSRKGEQADTVAGPGALLAEKLREKGYIVIHDTTVYDKKDGADNRNYAYSTARPSIESILEENPSIEIIIDLHRDSGVKRVTKLNGKSTAQIMLFNGLCMNASGPIDYLENKNLNENLAFSMQLKLCGDYMYPGLFKKIYLKNYRYNMHLCGKYLLIELGTEKNTVEEAYNAIEPLSNTIEAIIRQ